MKALGILAAASAVALAGFITACFAAPAEYEDEELGSGTANVEVSDPLEGAYVKQGGTPLHFVFKRGESKEDGTFLGEIEVDGQPQRASGKLVVGRDDMGTTFTLTPSGAAKKRDAGAAAAVAVETADGGAPKDSRSLVQQAFKGTVHYLKMGKNQTILVRGDTNAKTAHYKKARSWCGTAEDCDPEVQNTGLECTGESLTCSSKSTCACK